MLNFQNVFLCVQGLGIGRDELERNGDNLIWFLRVSPSLSSPSLSQLNQFPRETKATDPAHYCLLPRALTGIYGHDKLHSSSLIQKQNHRDLVQKTVVDVGLSPYGDWSLSSAAVISASLLDLWCAASSPHLRPQLSLPCYVFIVTTCVSPSSALIAGLSD
ncbi:hypothetical protein Bca52824_017791 [Brassica carinata]|uniref:Uncharacterized protein n=1 Tax=Brassica carinata TaxID=52824 RepID=A0A8X7VNA6_BRACI|nr:hypothetical protein Bca52824_017791 [Brassica carinata]